MDSAISGGEACVSHVGTSPADSGTGTSEIEKKTHGSAKIIAGCLAVKC